MQASHNDRQRSLVPSIATFVLVLVGLLAVVALSDDRFSDSGKGVGYAFAVVASAVVAGLYTPAAIIGSSGPSTVAGLRWTRWTVPAAVASAFVTAQTINGDLSIWAFPVTALGAAVANWLIAFRR